MPRWTCNIHVLSALPWARGLLPGCMLTDARVVSLWQTQPGDRPPKESGRAQPLTCRHQSGCPKKSACCRGLQRRALVPHKHKYIGVYWAEPHKGLISHLHASVSPELPGSCACRQVQQRHMWRQRMPCSPAARIVPCTTHSAAARCSLPGPSAAGRRGPPCRDRLQSACTCRQAGHFSTLHIE